VDGWRALGGGVDGEVTALARDADGTIFAARTIDASDADVLRFRDGAWEMIGHADGEIVALALAPDGALLAGGAFQEIGGVTAPQLARFDGAAWSSINHPVPNVASVLVDDRGICVGGLGAASIVACLPTGAVAWQTHSFPAAASEVDTRVDALGRDASGALVAGGAVRLAVALPEPIVRWSGSAWEPLGEGLSGVPAQVRAIASDASGALWVVGQFEQIGADGAIVANVAVWDDAWRPVGGVVRSWTESSWTEPTALAIATDGLDAYVGGALDGAGSTAGWTSARAIARRRGDRWAALRHPGTVAHGVGPGQLVRTRGACDPIVVGSWVAGEDAGQGAVARLGEDDVLDVQRSASLGGALAPQLAISRDGATWIGGMLFGDRIEALAVSDGGEWTFVPGPDGAPLEHVRALAIDPVDDTLYVGASFGSTHLMARAEDRWVPVGDRDIGTVHALAVDDERGLWIAESIDETRVRLARWDGAAWSVTAAFEGTVSRIVISDGAPVVVVDAPGGGAIVRRLRGSVFEALETPAALPTRVPDIAVHGAVLLAVGSFTIDGALHDGLARWEGTTWRAIGAPLDAVPESLAITARGVLVVGSFDTAGGVPSWGIARLERAD
ncbi:MAG: hypothetical protein M3Y87_29960, partial [Myxococcota bacterium]|nr:hypothetical protein [Myxococcota bacterium]